MKLQHKFFLSALIFVLALVFALPSQYKTIFKEGSPLGFLSFIEQTDINLGLDLQGGTQLEYKIDLSQVPEEDRNTVVEGVLGVLEKRIDGLGVSEPNVYASDVADEKHIYVELAGVSDIEEAKRSVGRTIQLEFKELAETSTEDEKGKVLADAQLALEEIKKDPATFAAVGEEISGESITYSTKEKYLDELPDFLKEKLTALAPGALLEEVVEGTDGYIFRAETGQAVPYEGYFVVQLKEVRTELRKDPANAEDFATVAREVSGDATVEVGYVTDKSDAPYVAALTGLETNFVSDVVEGDNAFYIVKALDALPAEPQMVNPVVLKFNKQDVAMLERQLEEKEVVEATNTKAKEEADNFMNEVQADPAQFETIAEQYATRFPTFVSYGGNGRVITRDDAQVEEAVRAKAFEMEVGSVSTEFMNTQEGLSALYVREAGTTAEGQATRLVTQIAFAQTILPTEAELNDAKAANEQLKQNAEAFLAGLGDQDFRTAADAYAQSNEGVLMIAPGFIKKEDAVDYVDTAFNLEAGATSGVVDTNDAFFIVHATATKPAGTAMVDAQVATIAKGDDATAAKNLAEDVLRRVREETQYVYDEIFFSTFPDQWKSALVDGQALTGEHFKYAEVMYQQVGPNRDVIVNVTFTDEGARMFETITGRNVGKPLAIFLGDQLVSNPVIREKISGGQATISGSFTLQEANELARDLNTGALPAPIDLVGQQNIGATLGKAALDNSITAALIGLAILFVYMILYYRGRGLVANLALVIYLVIMLALTKIFSVTLTLAGIAALILSIGMAVDANVLIFERLKEELASGRELRASIRTAFERAWSSIRDSNVSSLITAGILYWFGTGIIRGFAFMFTMGIIVSLFSAVWVSRVLLLMIASKKWGEKFIKF